jgi:CCR4-NOT transcription complex subunit 10
MEGRDSSPSPGDEESLSATAALAKEAAVLFQNRRFSECIDVLKQLLQKKEDDPKVQKQAPNLDQILRINFALAR